MASRCLVARNLCQSAVDRALVLKMIGEGHLDERLTGRIALVRLDFDGVEQDGGHAQRDRLGGKLEIWERGPRGQ